MKVEQLRIGQIKDRFNLLAYLSTFDGFKETGAVDEVSIDCTMCADTKSHFYWGISRGVGFCHRCGRTVDSIQFIQDCEGLVFGDALEFMENRKTFVPKETILEKKKDVKMQLPYGFIPLGPSANDEFLPPTKYLKERMVSKTQMVGYRIGFTFWKPYAKRIIFPIYMNRILTGFVARSIGDIKPHYLYAEGMRKSNCLFGYDIAKYLGSSCILVEGVFDVLRAGSNSIAILGKFLSNSQIELLRRAKFNRITVALDSDAICESTIVCKKLEPYFDVHQVCLPRGDPGSIKRADLQRMISDSHRFGTHENLKEYVEGVLR